MNDMIYPILLFLVGIGFILWYLLRPEDADDEEPKGIPVDPTWLSHTEAAAEQARRAELRAPKLSYEGTTYDAWLEAAIKTLMELWYPLDYLIARRWVLAEMETAGMVFPDPDYEWTLSAARGFAYDIATTYGEEASNR